MRGFASHRSRQREKTIVGWIIKHNGKSWEIDAGGYWTGNSFGSEWLELELDEDWIDYIRRQVGIPEITSAHKEVLEYVRQYYKRHGIAPDRGTISRECNMHRRDILRLFPDLRIAAIMAGLPCPISDDTSCPLGSKWYETVLLHAPYA